MSATDQDIRAIEYLALRVRKDAHGCAPWDAHGTHIVFAEFFKGMHLPTAIEIAVAHAQDPEAKTPAAVKRPFKPEAPKPDGRWVPPKRAEECDLHPGQRATNCGGCAADRGAGETKPPARQRPADPTADYRAERDRLRATRRADEIETEETA